MSKLRFILVTVSEWIITVKIMDYNIESSNYEIIITSDTEFKLI